MECDPFIFIRMNIWCTGKAGPTGPAELVDQCSPAGPARPSKIGTYRVDADRLQNILDPLDLGLLDL